MRLFKLLFAASILCLLSCEKEPDITNAMLDGDTIFDPSLYEPEKFKVSAKYPNPTADDLSKHIVIAIHGYSASTFEWQEFADWTDTNNGDSTYRVSQVLLDGHGRTYQDFKASTWQDWVSAATDEYQVLLDLGYTKISFAGSSTGGPIILDLIRSGYFNNKINPKNIFMIDGIVVPSTKVQTIANLIGPMLVYVETEQTAVEDTFWYRFRPQETIQELNSLMKEVRKDLEQGVTAPSGTKVTIFHSNEDPVASSTSAVLIYKGLKHADGTNINVQMMDSDIHVFTRLSLRTGVTQKQLDNQLFAFTQMASMMK